MNDPVPARIFALPLFLLLAACATQESGSGWTTEVDTLPTGAVRVVNTPPLGRVGMAAVGPTWVLEEELRIGSLDQEGPTTFGLIKGLVVTSDGRMAILDSQAQEVRVFGPSGEHLDTFGGKGAGPGELEGAWGLMLSPSGKLWVPDQRNARMSVFDPARGFEAGLPLHVFRYGWVWSGVMDLDGRILKPSLTLGPPRRNVLRVYDDRMTLLDSLPMPELPLYDPEDPPGSFFWGNRQTGMGYMGVPYYPHKRDLIDPRGGIWSTDEGDPSYRIKYWEPGGDTTLVLEARRPLLEIPEAERDSAISAIREELLEVGGARQDWSKVPTVRAAVSSMFVAEEGRLWIETASADSVRTFDLFDRSGAYLGSAHTFLKIYRYVLPTVRGDYLWAVVTDEFDVPYVVRARIREGGNGRTR
jgi:hypothetical protein